MLLYEIEYIGQEGLVKPRHKICHNWWTDGYAVYEPVELDN